MMDKHEKAFRELEQKLQQGVAVSDDELLEALGKIRIMTNTWHAAFLIATHIAPLCGYRPHLTKRLLPRMLYPLSLSGIGSAQRIIQWIQANLNAPNPFDGMSQVGLNWLKELINQPTLIQEVLRELSEADLQHELDELWEAYEPFIRIPRERVEFWPLWYASIFSKIKKGVVFIQIVVFEDTERSDQQAEQNIRILETLTEALAKHDPEGRLSFLFFSWETYGDLVGYYEQNDPHEMFQEVAPEKAQILWILNGKGLHVMSKDVTDLSVIEDYTLDLISQQV